MSHPLGVIFTDVGTLAGFDLSASEVSHTKTFSLTLYWQAGTTPTTSYTVFSHLLDAAGQVIAQNDSLPTNGSRPTTGWLQGEYVTDPHVLVFNSQGQNYTGTASIEVGLYDPTTNKRVLLANGADHVLLPISVTVH